MLYYYYFPFWESFLTACGAKVKLSPPTNKSILQRGLELAEGEICLPVKAFIGHVAVLASEVDYLLAPRVVKPVKKGYSCPKLLGLPDIVRGLFATTSKLLFPLVNQERERESLADWLEIGRKISGLSYWKLKRAYRIARCVQQKVEKSRQRVGYQADGGLRVGLIGHPYILRDSYLSLSLVERLRKKGVEVYLSEEVGRNQIRRAVSGLPKPLFWSFEEELVGAALFWTQNNLAYGLILVNSFGCGPDSLSQVLIETEISKHREMPFLNLIIDEHTSEAGFLTRLEAFLDMLVWRKINAG